ncbi:hypothetical protein FRC08_001715 [Ceratobasidium sp. 394]|nr:hypothetical protein FRC08_001715 [Ceratobasidium sp. 394]
MSRVFKLPRYQRLFSAPQKSVPLQNRPNEATPAQMRTIDVTPGPTRTVFAATTPYPFPLARACPLGKLPNRRQTEFLIDFLRFDPPPQIGATAPGQLMITWGSSPHGRRFSNHRPSTRPNTPALFSIYEL